MTKYLICLVTTSSIMLLSACGGGGGGASVQATDVPVQQRVVPSYQTLDSKAEATSSLGGIALRSNGATGSLDVTQSTGTITHNSGAIVLDDGTYSFSDSDGPDANRVLTDGRSTVVRGSRSFTGTYEYVTVYEQTYVSGGVTFDTNGIFGVVTRPADIPTTGSATYTGEAAAQLVTSTEGFDLSNGTSTVTADFGSGTVDVTMTGFTATNLATGNAGPAPIDTITATGMQIAGNRFSGGTVSTTNGGATASPTGPNTTAVAQGAFFGYDTANSTPDEVGGIFLMQGDNGIITGGFIAD